MGRHGTSPEIALCVCLTLLHVLTMRPSLAPVLNHNGAAAAVCNFHDDLPLPISKQARSQTRPLLPLQKKRLSCRRLGRSPGWWPCSAPAQQHWSILPAVRWMRAALRRCARPWLRTRPVAVSRFAPLVLCRPWWPAGTTALSRRPSPHAAAPRASLTLAHALMPPARQSWTRRTNDDDDDDK